MSNMFNFKYEIKKNDNGRPYVNILDQVDYPEHKFMAIEITRYLLIELLKDNQQHKELTKETENVIVQATFVLEEISDKIAMMISEQDDVLGELGLDVQDE